MKKITLISIFCLVCIVQVDAQHTFNWLIGSWKLKDKSIYEVWSASDDNNTLEGKSYRITGTDTIVMERIKLTYQDGAFHYMPDVPQNKGPVDFKITHYDNRSFVAENPKHDFPKIIRYTIVRKEGHDILEASIEGNGKVIPYRFEKVK